VAMFLNMPVSALAKPKITYITIGDVAAAKVDLPWIRGIAKIALQDINRYFEKEKLPYYIQVEYKDAKGSTATHLKMVQEFKSEGINLLLAGRWSSMARTSRDYIDANNMLMLSPSSTGAGLQIADDNLFRLCPSDGYLAPALAHVVDSSGIEYVIIIQRNDDWGKGLSDAFKNEYENNLQKTVLAQIQYKDTDTVSTYVAEAETYASNAIISYGASKVGVVLLAFNEATGILTTGVNNVNYPSLYGCKWFGADGTANSQFIINNAGEAAAHVGLYSIIGHENKGPSWDSVKSRYEAATGQIFTSYTAYEYDIFWIYALSAVKAGSNDPMAIKAVLPSVAGSYYGASGYCTLNSYGDRLNPGFDIWVYSSDVTHVNSNNVGYVDTFNIVTWFP
ncbi:MAG: ABC transporter substrate-binding protein, partial [Candidatus Bathyarchaeota archaeon]|nr:ABC transporter substrate-binding protein [Candidatus Bathyarchaeota archaeon]